MMSIRSLAAIVVLLGAGSASAEFQKWCGKYYQYGAPMPDHTDFMFPYPQMSDTPLLDFRCTPKSSFYLENDDKYDPPMMIIDANITHDVGSAYQASSGNLNVQVMLNGKVISSGAVAPGSMGNLMPMTLANLTTSDMPYNLSCSASIAGQSFSANSALSYKPTPPWGGTCGSKVDRLSGATLVRNATAGELNWKPLFPVGFFDEIGQNSTVNPAHTPLDRLYQAHENGMNLIHVRPAFPPREVMAEYLDTVESLGMYFTLDMSGSYKNATYVEDMVNWLKNRSNLIGWYTGDEPDGSDPASNATELAYKQIYELDGYHPVSVTLNCENYKFIEYGINGADQIRVDPYPVNVAAAFSRKYGTPCNSDYGCCGCDDCEGSMYDVIRRVDAVIDRSRLLGMYRTKQVWSVPQAFDDYAETFWIAAPDGNDVAVQMAIALNHGASGITPFDAPGAPLAAFTNASMIANLVTKYQSFFTTNSANRELVNTTLPYMGVNNIDVGCWKMKGDNGADMALFVAANFYLSEQDFLLDVQGKVVDVPFGNVTAVNGTAQFIMPGKSIAAVLMQM